ncbi:S8 family serine peptidase [Spirillospora sp. NPDC048819]|uniref:S8 family serine peptidase n=1 Tax=Spirillospora sp. NPDC048819 TaxID=3155268 RepID=UPI003400A0B0
MRWTAIAVLAGCLAPLCTAPVAHAAPAQAAPIHAAPAYSAPAYAAPAYSAPAYAAPCQPPAGVMTAQQLGQNGQPWAQQILNIGAAHERATGRGVKVAVVDSGVTAKNPQLSGQVLKGVDLTKTGPEDCLGHGTWVAGIIAAKKGTSPFYGVAPDAKIIPIKFAAQAQGVDSGLAAKGIDAAVRLGADIINVSTQSIGDDPRLRKSVENAIAKGVVIVAAAGNINPEDSQTPGLMYPSAYPGVISVGAVDQKGGVTAFSNPATPVSVMAPGQDIVTTAPDGTYAVAEKGTSFATPFVSGLAALIEEAYPDLTPAQVKQRIEGTAEGSKGVGSGNGMINPFEALTAVNIPVAGGGGAAGPPVKIAMADRPDSTTRAVALGIAGGALGVAALVAAGGVLIPLGRRRGWRPGYVRMTSDTSDGSSGT